MKIKNAPALVSKDRRDACGTTLLDVMKTPCSYQSANTLLTDHAGLASDITGGKCRFLSAFRSPLCCAVSCPDPTTRSSL